MAKPIEVTDPSVLSQLNFGGDTPTKRNVAVTDPAVLKQLNFGPAIQETVLDPTTRTTNPDTWADWIGPALQIGGSLAVASPAMTQGASLGFVVGGPVGALVGGLGGGVLSSAAMTFGGGYAGDYIEALIEGREFNPEEALKQSIDAAETDAIFTTVLGVAPPVVKIGYNASKQITGKAGASLKEIKLIDNLQAKVKELGGSLLPVMVDAQSKVAGYVTSVANASQVTKQTVNNYIDTYGLYMGNQVEAILTSLKAGTPKNQGEALQKLILQSDIALSKIVDPLYKAIEKTSNKANVVVRASEEAKKVALEFKNKYRAVKTNKKGEQVTTVNYNNAGVAGDVKYLEEIPNDLTFWEAHLRLSQVKKTLDTVTGANLDKNRAEVIGKTIDVLKNAMDDAAEGATNAPLLKRQYQEVTDLYSSGKKVVFSTWMEKALKVEDPTKIGAMLTATGNTVGIVEIKELMKLAAKYKNKLPKGVKVKGLDENPLIGIRKGFLEATLRSGSKESIVSFKALRTKLSDPKYRETFNELFKGSAVSKKIDTLMDELTILERAESLGSGFQLSIASGEVGVLKNPSILAMFKASLPAFIANRGIKPANVDKAISMLKAANAAEARGIVLPPEFAVQLGNLIQSGVKGGIVLSGAVNMSE